MTTTSEITIQTADQHPGSNPLSGWGLGTDHLIDLRRELYLQ